MRRGKQVKQPGGEEEGEPEGGGGDGQRRGRVGGGGHRPGGGGWLHLRCWVRDTARRLAYNLLYTKSGAGTIVKSVSYCVYQRSVFHSLIFE